MSGTKTWDEDFIARLRDLWERNNPQLSTAEIGRRLGVSKNSAIAKAHRLHLAARPSPLRAKLGAVAPAPRHAASLEGPTLPPLASTAPDSQSSRPENGPPPAWLAWCGQLSTGAFNQMRRAQHKVDCPVSSQSKSLRLWECTCGVSQPGSEVGTLTKSQVVLEPVAAIVVRRIPSELIVTVEPPPAVFKPRRSSICCWPIGQGKSIRFCDETSMAGKPYCGEHAKLAYVKIRTRTDDATADQSAA